MQLNVSCMKGTKKNLGVSIEWLCFIQFVQHMTWMMWAMWCGMPRNIQNERIFFVRRCFTSESNQTVFHFWRRTPISPIVIHLLFSLSIVCTLYYDQLWYVCYVLAEQVIPFGDPMPKVWEIQFFIYILYVVSVNEWKSNGAQIK